ncbi:rhamnan synthesis F family protein [Roseixanthobacter glucoisosaccharinicivorans]|uniref:rhamnan synthesis F family protein n=1 Tax=Roseixanthobacter glucoisosaccharinicivorans TaxID=3119923 RepID=UPI00372866CE
MVSFKTRMEASKQLLIAALDVSARANPVRRIRKALRLLSTASGAPVQEDRDVLGPALRAVRLPSASLSGGPVCLMVTAAADGRVFGHTLRLCADLKACGMQVVLIIATDRPDLDCLDPGPQVADAVITRENHGYDFAAWAAALRYLPEVWAAPEVLFANDSVYHATPALAATLERMRASTSDVVALTQSAELAPHFQSYLFLYQASALAHPEARAFWGEVRSLGDKLQIIRDYEVAQRAVLERAGLRVDILFPGAPGAQGENQLHQGWRALIADGFPFVKVQLLRDNPYGVDLAGWRGFLDGADFDVKEIAFHLGAGRDGAAALLEMR